MKAPSSKANAPSLDAQRKLKLIPGYVERGWMLVPLPQGAKAPAGNAAKGWQKKRIRDPKAIGDGNVGILLGEPSGGLTDVDLDWLEAAELADEFLPETPAIFGRPGKPRSHRLYIVEGAKTQTWQHGKKDEGGMIVELRSTGCQTVFPPSIHPSGETIAWDSFETPAPIEYDVLDKACGTLAAAALASRNWTDGSRQDLAFGLAGLMLKVEWPDDDVKHFIKAVAQHAGDDEVEKRVDAVRRTARGIAEGVEVAGYSGLVEIWGAGIADQLAQWLTGGSADAIRIVPGHLPEVVDAAEAALLANDPHVMFVRGGALMHLAQENLPPDEQKGAVRRAKGAVTLKVVGPHWLSDRLDRAATFEKYDGRTKSWRRVDCPATVAERLLARVDAWKAPVLQAIVQAPTLRRDGSILAAHGYDPDTGLYLTGEGPWPPIPDKPTRRHAERARSLLAKRFDTFPFESESAPVPNGADRSVLLAAILTVLVRWRLPAAPLFGFDAPTPGTGKSLLADSVSILATGCRASAMAYTGDPDELRKRLTAALLAGDTLLFLDNIKAPLTGDALCSMVTQASLKDRILGASRIVELPTTCTLLASGNNLTALDDMARRVLFARIDAKVERPEERRFKGDFLAELLAARGELVAAALTILRAHVTAGQPAHGGAPFGGFEEWDETVRAPLIWAGADDPLGVRERLREADPETAQLGALLMAWHGVLGEQPATLQGALAMQGEAGVDCPVGIAAMQITGDRDSDRINSRGLGRFISKHVGRPIDGLRFERGVERGGSQMWRVRQELPGATDG
jgi:hypothetical protein